MAVAFYINGGVTRVMALLEFLAGVCWRVKELMVQVPLVTTV